MTPMQPTIIFLQRNQILNRIGIIFLFFVFQLLAFIPNSIRAQENLRPLHSNLGYLCNSFHESKSAEISFKNKHQSFSLNLPFIEDFFYATNLYYPKTTLWKDSNVFVNTGFAIAPPSIGVATFDGLNKRGYPYTPSLTNLNVSLPADTLTSQPINLLVTAASQTLQLSDSIALTFYYQARGNGESPESMDSLIVDFFKPNKNEWITQWYATGNANANINDTVFKRAFIMVNDADFLDPAFQFRFRNKANTAGDFDHWHVDYIHLDKNRNRKADTVYNDLTFAYVPTSYLKNYAAIPWKQFNTGEIGAKNSVKIKNNGGFAINHTYENKLYNKNNVLLDSYTGGPTNLCPFKPSGCAAGSGTVYGYSNYPPHANPPINYTFTPLSDSADFVIKHSLALTGSSTDFINENDTVIQYQRFRNYYSYDDGGAEGGYYILGTGGKMALKFTINVQDELRALRIYFDPVGNFNEIESAYRFKMCLWSATANGPGDLIFADTLMKPIYYQVGHRGVPEYQFKVPKQQRMLNPGTYYVGIQQQVAAGITVGFDKNNDYHSALYFDSGNGWQQSNIKGSLMIRPVFGDIIIPPMSVSENNFQNKSNQIVIFPNPSSNEFTIKHTNHFESTVILYNNLGQIILQEPLDSNNQNFSTVNIDSGIYLVVIKSNKAIIHTQRLIIQH